MSYTTKGKLQNYMMVDIDSSFDSQISDWITAVENYINKYTNRLDGFENTTGSTRFFDGNGKREIDIDEFTSLTSVVILEYTSTDTEFTLTEGWGNDFVTYPYNDIPKYRLIMSPDSTPGVFLSGKRRIQVTAVWGNSTTVPKDIELAATILLSSIAEKGIKGGKIKSESLGDYSVSFEDIDKVAHSTERMTVLNILDRYKIFKL